MDIISNRKETIFRRDFEGKSFYSIGLSKKKQDGSFENGYMNVQFNKGIELENKTQIMIKKAWLDFYIKNRNTIPYIRISEYEVVSFLKDEPKEEKKNGWESAKDIEIDDDALPFY